MTRNRIISVIILSVMFICTLSVSVFAFPFNEFTFEDNTLEVHTLYDHDTDYENITMQNGIHFARTIEYEGKFKGNRRPVYTQKARLTIAAPKEFDLVKDKNEGEENDNLRFKSTTGNFYEWYDEEGYQKFSDNKVSWAVVVDLEDIETYSPEDDETMDEAMQKHVESAKKRILDSMFDKETWPNLDKDPVKVTQDANGYSIITHALYDLTDYYGIEEDWGGFKQVYNEGWYATRIQTIDGLPGFFIVAKCGYRVSFDAEIEGPDHTEYKAVYDEGKKTIDDFLALDFGEKFVDISPRITVTWEEPVISPEYSGETETEAEEIHEGITRDAEETPGEDEGVSVPAAIVIGVVSAGAAVAAAAAAGASSDGGDGDDKKKKSYKMYVQKDFGNAIRRGGDPVKVRARMAERGPDGAERDRDDLTANIGVSGDGITVHGASLSGRYCEATVSVPQNNDNEKATLTFTYFGEGGSFENSIVFKLVDGPSLRFVEETAAGSGEYYTYSENCGFDAIPGDSFTYESQFMIVDATTPPPLEDISADSVEGFDISFEATGRQYVYKLIVKNNTPEEGEHDVFAKPRDINFEIRVKVEGEKEPVRGYVTVKLYPEGITVDSREIGKKNDVKYVRVQAYEKDYVGDLDRKWQVSEMYITLAVKGEDKALIDPKGTEYTFEKIKGGEGKGSRADKEASLAEKYEYEEAYGTYNDRYVYSFDPRANLVEPDDGSFFIVLLPVKCEYKGDVFEAEVPLRLRGKDIDPLEGWEKEYSKLKERVREYSVPGEEDRWLERIDELATEPRCSTEQLRLTSKYLIRQYMSYWTIEGIKDRQDAELYDTIVSQLEWIKFIGDCAFSFLVNAYAGPVAEAIISPVKDYLAEAAGELIGCWNQGTELKPENFSIAKTVEGAFDNLASSKIDVTNWKKAAATIGAYFVYASVKNYIKTWNEKNQSDLWGSICKGFSDATVQGLKSAAGELFTNWIKKNKKFQELIGNRLAQCFNKYAGKGRTFNLKDQKIANLQHQLNNSLGLEGELRKLAGYAGDSKNVKIAKIDIIQKYLTELVGKKAGEVKERADKTKVEGYDIKFNESAHLIFTMVLDEEDGDIYEVNIDLTVALMNVSCGFFGLIYNEIFGQVPVSTRVLDIPKDPPLPPAKK